MRGRCRAQPLSKTIPDSRDPARHWCRTFRGRRPAWRWPTALYNTLAQRRATLQSGYHRKTKTRHFRTTSTINHAGGLFDGDAVFVWIGNMNELTATYTVTLPIMSRTAIGIKTIDDFRQQETHRSGPASGAGCAVP